MPPVRQTVSILDSHYLNNLLGSLNLRRRHLAKADVADLALLLHAAERSEGLFERRARVDAM